MRVPTFKATLKRETKIVERTSLIFEADSQEEAETTAIALALDEKTAPSWSDESFEDTVVEDPEVESVILHAYDGETESDIVEET